MRSRYFRLRIPSEHARDLVHAVGALENGDVRSRDTALRSLRHDDVMVRAGGDLGQMRYREDLMLASHSPQRVTNLQSNAAANSGVDLVENQSRHPIDSSENRLERQHHA